MTDQESHDKTGQNTKSEESKQEIAKLVKRHGREILDQLLLPSNLVTFVNAWLAFVGIIIAFGVLAYYTGHKVTQEIVFYSVPALLIIPIVGIWYLRLPSGFLDRVFASPFGRFIARHFSLLILFNAAFAIYQIATAIWTFPQHPRYSLTTIVYFIGIYFVWALAVLTSRINNLQWALRHLLHEFLPQMATDIFTAIETSNAHQFDATLTLTKELTRGTQAITAAIKQRDAANVDPQQETEKAEVAEDGAEETHSPNPT